jgi:NAD kinase
LGNFDIKEYKKVLDATVVKAASYDKICLDLRMRLSLTLNKVIADPKDETFKFEQFEFQSLNEVTIMRNNEAMAQIEIYINNVLLTVVQGDG